MADVIMTEEYRVRNKNVFLSVIIGEGQFGTSDVLLDGERLLRTSGPLKLLIGKGSDIVDKALLVRSVVNDVSSATNRMSITYHLTGGAAVPPFVAKGKVAEQGDLLIFEATFSFV
jgi:hypothetical protein